MTSLSGLCLLLCANTPPPLKHKMYVVGLMFLLFVSLLADLPRVLTMPVRLFLPRGMMGRIDCPVDANPPATLIVWTKNEKVVDFSRTKRMKTNKQGTLVIYSVISTDEGRYACTPYSPLGAGQASTPVQVLVRGECTFYLLLPTTIYPYS